MVSSVLLRKRKRKPHHISVRPTTALYPYVKSALETHTPSGYNLLFLSLSEVVVRPRNKAIIGASYETRCKDTNNFKKTKCFSIYNFRAQWEGHHCAPKQKKSALHYKQHRFFCAVGPCAPRQAKVSVARRYLYESQ